MKWLKHALSLAFLMAAASLPAQAQGPAKPFYAGKVISIVTPYAPGGSYDMYSRLAARYMAKYIPGNPTIVVQNKSGVAGTIRSFSDNMPDDGTVMGLFPETIAVIQLTEPQIGQWDVRKLAYVGSLSDINAVFVLRKNAPAKTINDFKTVKTNVGCNSPVAEAYFNPVLLKNLLGYKFNMICGYSGGPALIVATQQGEIDMSSGSWAGWRINPEVKNGNFKVVIQGGLKRAADLPNIPLMQELVSDPTQKKIIEFWNAGSAIGRALVVRKSVPQDRINILRDAFDKAVKDPALLAEAAKMQLPINPSPGVEVQRISEGILQTPKSLIAMAIKDVK